MLVFPFDATFFFPLKSYWFMGGRSVGQTQSIRSWVLVTRWSWWLASAIDHSGVFPWSALIRKDPPLGWRENKEQSRCCFPIFLSKGRKISCMGWAINAFQLLPPTLITYCTLIHSNYWSVLASNCLWIRGAETSKGKLWNLHTYIGYGGDALATVANMK